MARPRNTLRNTSLTPNVFGVKIERVASMRQFHSGFAWRSRLCEGAAQYSLHKSVHNSWALGEFNWNYFSIRSLRSSF